MSTDQQQEQEQVSTIIEKEGEEESVTLEQTLDQYIKETETKFKELKGILSKFRGLKKEIKNLELKLKKTTEKKKRKTSNSKKLNGFKIPVLISKDLVNFLKKNLETVLTSTYWTPVEGDTAKEREKKEITEKENKTLLAQIKEFKGNGEDTMARTDVTKLLTRYLQYHQLQDPEEKKYVKFGNSAPSVTFLSLLSEIIDNEGKQTRMTFINMQRYISHHFYKKKINGFPEKKGSAKLPTVTSKNKLKTKTKNTAGKTTKGVKA